MSAVQALAPLEEAGNHARPAPQQIVIGAALGHIVSSCIQAAIKLDVFEQIAKGTHQVSQLAEKAKVNEAALYRILRVLEMAGLLAEQPSRNFQLTEAGSLLTADAPGSMRDIMQFMTDALHSKVYAQLTDAIKAGQVPFERVFGEEYFKWINRPENKDEATLFHNGMVSFSGSCIGAFLEAYDFTQFHTIADVGGGLGGIVRAILKACPKLRGMITELPEVVEPAKQAIAEDGLTNRCTAVPSDFFKSIPAGADAYFMKHILHDWNDEDATCILKNIRTVIPSNGKLILAETVVPNGPASHPGKLIDIEMLVFLKGKERTEPEWRKLLEGAGFRLNRIVETKSPLNLIEAVPA
jgi:predicted transcriptional regulator